MKTILQIEKVNPILVALVMCLLIFLLIQTGILDDLKWKEISIDQALQARLSGFQFLPFKSLTEHKDGMSLSGNGLSLGQFAEGKSLVNLTDFKEPL